MSRRPVLCIDTETTGLNWEQHDCWEVAALERHPDGTSTPHLYRMEPDLAKADPGALRVNKYYERTQGMRHRDGRVYDLAGKDLKRSGVWTQPKALAPVIARLLDDAVIVAANPTFDAGFLTAFLRAHGHAPTWHYRLRDIGSMAWGYLSACLALGIEGRDAALGVPSIDASTDDFARALGVDPDQFERHSALGDCLLLAACLDVIEGAP